MYIKIFSCEMLTINVRPYLLQGGPPEIAASDIDFHYDGAAESNDAGFDKGTYAERQMPALSGLKQSNMERMSTYTTDSNRVNAGKSYYGDQLFKETILLFFYRTG